MWGGPPSQHQRKSPPGGAPQTISGSSSPRPPGFIKSPRGVVGLRSPRIPLLTADPVCCTFSPDKFRRTRLSAPVKAFPIVYQKPRFGNLGCYPRPTSSETLPLVHVTPCLILQRSGDHCPSWFIQSLVITNS